MNRSSIKRVGILNFQYSTHNYGAVLQAAALEEYIKCLGYEVKHINFIPVTSKKSFIRRLLSKVIKVIVLKQNINKRPKILNNQVFEEFRKQYLNRTIICSSDDEVKDVSKEFDAVVVGSDQVWRASKTGKDALIYFLSSVSNRCRKISYAASFGSEYWELTDSSVNLRIKKSLHDFDFISVREDTGVEICDKVFDVKSLHVIDPTLLIDRSFFEKIIKNSSLYKASGKIVYYKLDVEKRFSDLIDMLEMDYGCESKNIYYTKDDDGYYYSSVSDWLNEIKNSRLVVTDSFHCVCFAIIFQREFICVANNDRGLSRLQSLLNQLGLKERIIYEPYDKGFKFDEINYDDVYSRLEDIRRESSTFLIDSLK